MFLDYLSLAILIAGLTITFYAAVYILMLPYRIAKKRNHPHAEAIHVACWLSPFTLHVLWPFVYVWACTHAKTGEEAARGKVAPFVGASNGADAGAITELAVRMGRVEARLHMSGIPDPNGHPGQ